MLLAGPWCSLCSVDLSVKPGLSAGPGVRTVSPCDSLRAGSSRLGAVGGMMQTFTDRTCPSSFVQSFHREGLELPGVKTRLGPENSGCLYWRGTNESREPAGRLRMVASLPASVIPLEVGKHVLAPGLGWKSLLRPRLASDASWGSFFPGTV